MPEYRGAARVIAADCLCFRARRVSRALTRMYDEALRPLGIHATQLTLLTAIAMSGKRGGMMNRLSEVLAVDGTTLSRNLRPLERAGLLRIERSPADRRVRRVFLTPEGERKLEDALPLWTQAHERVVATLGAEAAADLRECFDAAASAAAKNQPVQQIPE